MVIALTFVTILITLAFAIYDLRQTEKAIRDGRRSTMTTPSAEIDTRL